MSAADLGARVLDIFQGQDALLQAAQDAPDLSYDMKTKEQVYDEIEQLVRVELRGRPRADHQVRR